MDVFSSIKNAIFGKKEAKAARPAPGTPTAAAKPAANTRACKS